MLRLSTNMCAAWRWPCLLERRGGSRRRRLYVRRYQTSVRRATATRIRRPLCRCRGGGGARQTIRGDTSSIMSTPAGSLGRRRYVLVVLLGEAGGVTRLAAPEAGEFRVGPGGSLAPLEDSAFAKDLQARGVRDVQSMRTLLRSRGR